MGAIINFYKDIKMEKCTYNPFYEYSGIVYINSRQESWCYKTLNDIGKIFKKYTNKCLPIMLDEDSYETKDDLIKPEDMVKYCNIVLSHNEDDLVNEYNSNIKFIKKMSEDGYYTSCEL